MSEIEAAINSMFLEEATHRFYENCYREAIDLLEIKLQLPQEIKLEFQSFQDSSSSVKHSEKTPVAYIQPHNINKNRDLNVAPYADASMVVLEQRMDYPPAAAQGYINASFVKTCSSEKVTQFIATQHPLPDTRQDFWMMIIQNHCPAIVMLTHQEDKCEDYFPASDGEVTYGNICVTSKLTRSPGRIIIRDLEVKYRESEEPPHRVIHIQYGEWTAEVVPETTQFVREIIQQLLDHVPISNGPVVVHCSTGSGRTGAYCTIHSTIQRILTADFSGLNLSEAVSALRSKRIGMDPNEGQYTFCHKAVIEELKDCIPDYGDAKEME